jgi:cytochrome c biogenesis protein ResB
MWNTLFNAFWFIVCMFLLIFVTALCVIVDLTVSVISFFKKLFNKDRQHN